MLGPEEFGQIRLRVQAGAATPDDLRQLCAEVERLRNVLSDIAAVAVGYDGMTTVQGLCSVIDDLAWMARSAVNGDPVYASEGAMDVSAI